MIAHLFGGSRNFHHNTYLLPSNFSIMSEKLQAPKELEDSHPAIAQEMSQTWAEAWGDLAGPAVIALGGGLGVV